MLLNVFVNVDTKNTFIITITVVYSVKIHDQTIHSILYCLNKQIVMRRISSLTEYIWMCFSKSLLFDLPELDQLFSHMSDDRNLSVLATKTICADFVLFLVTSIISIILYHIPWPIARFLGGVATAIHTISFPP